ncbi:hypothetical protein MAR_009199, partial [Mya arenaria]
MFFCLCTPSNESALFRGDVTVFTTVKTPNKFLELNILPFMRFAAPIKSGVENAHTEEEHERKRDDGSEVEVKETDHAVGAGWIVVIPKWDNSGQLYPLIQQCSVKSPGVLPKEGHGKDELFESFQYQDPL